MAMPIIHDDCSEVVPMTFELDFIRDELMPHWEANNTGPHPAETRSNLMAFRENLAPLVIQLGRDDY